MLVSTLASLHPEHAREFLGDPFKQAPVGCVSDLGEDLVVVCWVELGLHDSVAELVLRMTRQFHSSRRRVYLLGTDLLRISIVEQCKQRARLAQLISSSAGL